MGTIIIASLFSYIIGSIPSAYILGKLFKKIDIRDFGSHNVGATNAFRVLGKSWGIAVLLMDILKGFLPVAFLGDYLVGRTAYFSEPIIRIILGVSCVAGHNWTVFLGFRGGKGVATSAGVLLALAMRFAGLRFVFLGAILLWIFCFAFFRIVSLSSIISGFSVPVLMLWTRQKKEFLVAGIILFLLLYLCHRSNIKRLLNRQEGPLV
jgi:glycerol-3-phosphate acyltransferase PlsY